MNMVANTDILLRDQLLNRRQKLESVASTIHETAEIKRLLREVDQALGRMANGVYGLCAVCRDPIEPARLMANPLAQFCLDHLTPDERQALEEDLEMASRIQRELLPRPDVHFDGWDVHYHYEPAGMVSGDYCDLVMDGGGNLYFMFGDVMGKGVAASMLMVHLHAMFRSLISVGLSLNQLVERANRVFCESTLSTHYATLVCGKASRTGETEIVNAGHLPPLVIGNGRIAPVNATGIPLGLFCSGEFSTDHVRLGTGDALLLYTDGLSEAEDLSGSEYGRERLLSVVGNHRKPSAESFVAACMNDVAAFRLGAPKKDDLTIMALRRV